MAGKITFKVETTGKRYGVKIWSDDDTKTELPFKKDNTCVRTLAKGDYTIYWVYWGEPKAPFKLTISDAAGNTIKTFTDKIRDGKDFEHDMNSFSIP